MAKGSEESTGTGRPSIDAAAAAIGEQQLSLDAQCRRYGDFSIFESCPEVSREMLRSRDFLTIHPTEFGNRLLPEKRWKPYWHLLIKDNLQSMRDLMALKSRGFVTATAADGFEFAPGILPPNAEGHFVYGGMLILMVQSEEAYRRERDERNMPAKYIVERTRQSFHTEAEQGGIGTVEAEADGDDEITQDQMRTVIRGR